jgi:hypothetical protein
VIVCKMNLKRLERRRTVELTNSINCHNVSSESVIRE